MDKLTDVANRGVGARFADTADEQVPGRLGGSAPTAGVVRAGFSLSTNAV